MIKVLPKAPLKSRQANVKLSRPVWARNRIPVVPQHREDCAEVKACMRRFRKFSQGGVKLQTRVGPTKFYNFKTHTLKNRGGGGGPDHVPPLDPRMKR